MKIKGGISTALSAAFVVPAGTRSLRLEAAGPSLKLFYGPSAAPPVGRLRL